MDDWRKYARQINSASRDRLAALPIGGDTVTDAEGRASLAESEDMGPLERLSSGKARGEMGDAGDGKTPAERTGLMGTKPTQDSFSAKAYQQRPLTAEELMKKAEEMLAMNEAKHAAALDAGPSVTSDEERGVPAWLRGYMRNPR